MTYPGTTQRAASSRQSAMYEAPALILVLALCGVTILSLVHPGHLAVTPSDPLDIAIIAASLIIAAGATYFALGEFLLYGRASSVYVGLAFIALASGDASMGLVPLLGGWKSQTNWVIYGWGIFRIVGAGLLVAAALAVDRRVPVLRRVRMLVTGLGLVFILTLVVATSVYYARASSVETPLQAMLQLLAGVLFFAASVRFWQAAKPTHETWFFWLSYSLGIAGFAQIQFAIHQYPVGVVQPGDILRLVFFTGILLALAAQLSQDYRRLRWQARELEALHAVMTAPVVEDVGAVVQHIAQIVSDTLEGNARILLAEREGRSLRDPLTAQMMHLDHDSIFSPAENGQRRVYFGIDEGPQGHVALGVPLGTPRRRFGMLMVVRDTGNDFSAHDVRLLRAFGAQASVLLERSLLYEEVAAGAILQERSRLAREIHDGLAQHLAFLKMRVGWLRRSPGTAGPDQLSEIEGVLETALIEARHAITTLRAEPEGTSTADAISQYAEEFGQVSGLTVEVERVGDLPDVGPKTRVELLRVVQEALNNVRKHAQATSVQVAMEAVEGGVIVGISDDGQGFSIEQSLDGHFGLQIMRERAESVGGTLEVHSGRNVGTQVTIWVPVHDAEEPTALPVRSGLA